jgi:hypothetical protein
VTVELIPVIYKQQQTTLTMKFVKAAIAALLISANTASAFAPARTY